MITLTVIMTVVILFIFMGTVSAHGQNYHVTIKSMPYFHTYCVSCKKGAIICSDCALDTNSSLSLALINCVMKEHTEHPCVVMEKVNWNSLNQCILQPSLPYCKVFPHLSKYQFPHNPPEDPNQWTGIITI